MTSLIGKIDIHVVEGRNLPNRGVIRTSDPYVMVWSGDQRLAYTETIQDNVLNPKWDARFKGIDISSDEVEHIEFEVLDQVCGADKFLGRVLIPSADVHRGEVISGWFKLLGKKGEEDGQGELNLALKYTSVEALPSNQEVCLACLSCRQFMILENAHRTICLQVPNTYFAPHSGCRVTLYQDAHQDEHSLPAVRLGPGNLFEQRSCWTDLHKSLTEATQFIYITGWSVWPALRMVRGSDGESETLGDLLKRKASEGVSVLIMVWDEETSNALNRKGLMMTHDEECKAFFANTKVHFAKVGKGFHTSMRTPLLISFYVLNRSLEVETRPTPCFLWSEYSTPIIRSLLFVMQSHLIRPAEGLLPMWVDWT